MAEAGAILVLDAWPVVELATDGPQATDVAQRVRDAAVAQGYLPMSTVNWGEAVYSTILRGDETDLGRVMAGMRELPIAPVDVDVNIAARAAELKLVHGIGYADSIAAALAMLLNAPLMTGDPDFLPLQDAGLKLEYLGYSSSG